MFTCLLSSAACLRPGTLVALAAWSVLLLSACVAAPGEPPAPMAVAPTFTLAPTVVVQFTLAPTTVAESTAAQPTARPPMTTSTPVPTQPPALPPSPAPTATANSHPPTATPSAVPPAVLAVAWDDRAPFRTGLIQGAQGVLGGLPDASVYHLDVQVAPDLTQVRGAEEVRYVNSETAPLADVYFRLYPNMMTGAATIKRLTVDGAPVAPIYEQERTALRVPLARPLPPGEAIVIWMEFSVDVPEFRQGAYGHFSYSEGVLALGTFYPIIPVYDASGWHLEVPPPEHDVTFTDASFYLVRVTAPADLTLIASGVPVALPTSGATPDDMQRVTYAAGPMREFYLAAGKGLTAVSETAGEVTVNSYAFPAQAEAAKLVLGYAVEALEIFGEHFGPYPYSELDLLAAPCGTLGLEYPGAVVIKDQHYDNLNKGELKRGTVHEVGHQWFYAVIGSDQVNQPWLDEGMTQLSNYVYYAGADGEATAEWFYRTLWDRWALVSYEKIPIGMRDFDYAGDSNGSAYRAIIYGRSALFLTLTPQDRTWPVKTQTLVDVMGQDKFDAFLRDYFQQHYFGVATTESFKRLAEQHCQCDLTATFEEWVYQP